MNLLKRGSDLCCFKAVNGLRILSATIKACNPLGPEVSGSDEYGGCMTLKSINRQSAFIHSCTDVYIQIHHKGVRSASFITSSCRFNSIHSFVILNYLKPNRKCIHTIKMRPK